MADYEYNYNKDKEYINRVSYLLKKFVWVGDTAKFRCPFCGDSKKNEHKTRGYFYRGEDRKYYFKCFKGCPSLSFANFLKTFDPILFAEYKRKDYITEQKLSDQIAVIDVVDNKKTPPQPVPDVPTTNHIPSLDQLPRTHPANVYFDSRRLPEAFRSRLYYSRNFSDYLFTEFLVDSEKLETYSNRKFPKDGRIIIPYADRSGKQFIVQGRALNANASMRYITVKKDDEMPKIFGLNSHNPEELTFITEGPIDSFFLPNALAIGGVGLSSDIIKTYIQSPPEKVVMIYDNEPRSKAIVQQIENAIELGVNVVIWENIPTDLKDINDMVLYGGMTRTMLYQTIADRIVCGQKARLALSAWKKI